MIAFNPKSYKGFDILCRVYRNQDPAYWKDPNRDEKEQICADVLFSTEMNREGSQAMSWLPRGAAAFIAQ